MNASCVTNWKADTGAFIFLEATAERRGIRPGRTHSSEDRKGAYISSVVSRQKGGEILVWGGKRVPASSSLGVKAPEEVGNWSSQLERRG